MATPIQRVVAISNALVNGVASVDQIRRVGRGIASQMGRLAEYDAADDTGKSNIFLEGVAKALLATVLDLESSTAAKDASEMARLKVYADFQSSP